MDTTTTCTETLGCCVCSISGEHEVHECSAPSVLGARCLGAWKDDGTIVRYPTGAVTDEEAQLDSLLMFVAPEELQDIIAERVAALDSQ